MKNIRIVILLIIAGCSSDLEIVDQHEPVPVIYAQIDPYDSMNFIRVAKTFKIKHQEDWGLLNTDSLEFKTAEVYLHGKKGDQITWTEQFTETTGIKEDGFFPSGKYQVYKLDHRLPIVIHGVTHKEPGMPDIDSLIVEVRIPELNLISKASIKLLLPVKMINYKSRYLVYVYGSYPSVYAISDPGELPDPDFQYIYQQIDFTVHFKEYYKDGFLTKQIHWLANTGWDDNAYFIYPERIFNPMMELIPENSAVIYRTLDSIDISLLRTSKIFNNYLFIKDIWENTDKPPYTNFDNSYGLFFSITRDGWTGMLLNWQAMDSLCDSANYRSLRFRKSQ